MQALRWGYIVGLHLLLAVLIWKTDAMEGVQRRLGWRVALEMDRGWHKQVDQHRLIDEKLAPGALLFIGDSLIHDLDVARFDRPAANFGIGGDTTLRVLARLDTYRSIATASAVVLLVGINDLKFRPPEAVTANLTLIVARLANSTQVIAVGLLPVDESRFGRNSVLRHINAELARACAGQPRCRYVDAWPVLAPAGSLAAEHHVGDGLHLSRLGYDRLAGMITAALAP